jgi:Leucine-rich repeat (LRR) protein
MARNKAYYEAEKKIEEALKSGATELHLSYLQYRDSKPPELTELPDLLWQLTQLTKLNLSDNQLMSLPDSLGQLTQLTKLNLSDNQLMSLPESLERLTQLTELDLSSNQLTSLPESIGQLRSLLSLQLMYNHLSSLPDSITNLEQLRYLNLGGNKLGVVPEVLRGLVNLRGLWLWKNSLDEAPSWISEFTSLEQLSVHANNLTDLPSSLAELDQLLDLTVGFEHVGSNPLEKFPTCINGMKKLRELDLYGCQINLIPSWLAQLTALRRLGFSKNIITDLPIALVKLEHLTELKLEDNPLNPELAEAAKQGIKAIKAYLGARADGEVILNEAKLILVGEGGVGKTSLLAALHGEEWVENRRTTYGMEVDVTSLVLKDPVTGSEIIFNGWDFGGQDIYRHTHQLFFTAPAVYRAVWEPRRGPEQSRVSEWIKMIKHRAFDESRPDLRPRVLVVATHGGPKERLAHIDEQALRDEFGDMIAGFTT